MAKNFSNVEYPAPPPAHTKNESLQVLDLFKLNGKVASITGSSSGIGYALAEAFAQVGADVAIWYNSHDATGKAEALAKKYGVKVKAYKANVSSSDAVKQTIEQQIKDFGHLDIVVANAGIPWTKGAYIDQDDDKHFDQVVDVDLKGVGYVAKHAGRHFRERFEKEGKKGALVFTASMSGHIVNVPQFQATYNAAKAGVRHFAKSLAVEFAPFARVNSVSPGYINTEISDFVPQETQNKWWSLVPLGRGGETAELVGAYLFLASDAGSYATGTDIIVDGGYTLP
uniref:Carbonyl reductase S1 n=1 Tax=Starmerella magnoliae TaxID=5490 RepID=Q9C4B3_9ASCO|nr:recombinant KRED [synthetic construct]AHZ34231.1 carbonyl reductase SyS1 [synthetic construct]BAB21578.1 carbonyl reductase S1 [Starmerella magnoliae]